MKIFSYVLKTASGDLDHQILIDKDYDGPIDYMKHEMPDEYEAWKDEGCKDSEIDYEEFDKVVLEV